MNEIFPSNSPAVQHADQDISYTHFCCAVGRLSDKLSKLHLKNSVPVAIMMERGFSLYTSQFAVLACGGFFIPIDPANPDERIRFLLSDSLADCIIVDSTNALKIRKLQLNLQVIEIDADSTSSSRPDDQTASPISFPHAANDPAYMIYTSGSTGKPKGVCIHWEAICNHNRWFIDEYQISSRDRCLQIASIGFDISIEEIFTTLRGGACLVTISKQALNSPVEFIRWVNDQKLTVLNMPTALWHNVVPALEMEALSDSIRLVIIGGEKVKRDLVKTWLKHVSTERIRLVNAYGPTETTITATVSDLAPENLEAIGRPIKNLQCHIVDKDGKLVDSHVSKPGELYISGVGVAKGYWNRPEQTANAFLHCQELGGQWCYRTGDKAHWNEEGQLKFLGRIDNQVKLRGFRIELHEIEHAIGKHPEITNAIVRKTDLRHEQLVCFATTAKTRKFDARESSLQQELLAFLKKTLPSYMVPAQFYFLDEFPTTIGGKVDTRELLSIATSTFPCEPNSGLDSLNKIQKRIAEVWRSVLGNPPASLETTFEQSGGDSLAAMALALGLEKSFPERTFGVATLLSYSTVSQLAKYVGQSKFNSGSDDGRMPIVNSLGQSPGSRTPCLVFLHPGGGSSYLYNQLLSKSIKQNYSILILDSPWLTGKLPNDGHRETTESIARRYASVLAQRLDPGTKIITSGYSFGGILAFETARFLMKHDFEIQQVINIDQPIPNAIQIGGLTNRMLNWFYRLKTPRLTWKELNYSKEKEALRNGQKTSFTNPEEMLRSFDLEDIHASIEDVYIPQYCDVEMHLIRGDVIEAKYKVDKDYGWSKHAKRLIVHRVTGTHFTIFMGRNLQNLRNRFQQLIRSTSDEIGINSANGR